MSKLQKKLSIPELLKTIRKCFTKIPDSARKNTIPLTDFFMSGLAIFGLKYPSLLQFDQSQNEKETRHN